MFRLWVGDECRHECSPQHPAGRNAACATDREVRFPIQARISSGGGLSAARQEIPVIQGREDVNIDNRSRNDGQNQVAKTCSWCDIPRWDRNNRQATRSSQTTAAAEIGPGRQHNLTIATAI